VSPPSFRPVLLHNTGAPPGTRIKTRTLAVERQVTIFDLTACCIGEGLVDVESSTELNRKQALKARWGNDVERFLRSIRGRGLGRAMLDARAAEFHGAAIGWTINPDLLAKGVSYQLCCDIRLTLVVLSRRSNDLFLPRREPRWTWEQLFGSCFALSDSRFSGHSISRHLLRKKS
jgi:hypothetical protein